MSDRIISDIQALAPVTGDDNKYLCQNFDTIKDNQSDPGACSEALTSVARILKRCFDLDVSFTILDTREDLDFFAFHIYPDIGCINNIIDVLCYSDGEILKLKKEDGSNFDSRKSALEYLWKNNKIWQIDVDAKLFYSLSVRFTPREIVALLLYEIERRVFSFTDMLSVYEAVSKLMFRLDRHAFKLMHSSACCLFLAIPFLQACSYTNFTTDLPDESLLSLLPDLGKDYRSALTKIATKYSSGLVDPLPTELLQKLSYTFSWMVEGLVGLKYTLHDIKKALTDAIAAEKSFYVKNILISIFELFANYDKEGIIAEAHVPQVSPKFMDMKDAIKMEAFTKRLKTVYEATDSQLLDSLGRCKKVTQEEIDVLRIEIEKIENVDDKIYLLEKVYNKLAIVNNALDLIGDKETRGRVRDSKEKLLKQQEDLMQIREMIMAKKITPEHYGLYIKYPAGYEG